MNRKPSTAPGCTFTMALDAKDRTALGELSRRLRKTKASCVRTAIHVALHLVQEQEDRKKQIMTADADGSNPVGIHFVW